MENVLPLYVLLCAPDSVIKEGRVQGLGLPRWEVTSRCARVTEEREHANLFFMLLGRKQYACLAMFAVTRWCRYALLEKKNVTIELSVRSSDLEG